MCAAVSGLRWGHSSQDLPPPDGGADGQPLREPELRKNVKTFDVVDLKVAEEKKNRFCAFEMTGRPVDAIPGVEKDVVPLRRKR